MALQCTQCLLWSRFFYDKYRKYTHTMGERCYYALALDQIALFILIRPQNLFFFFTLSDFLTWPFSEMASFLPLSHRIQIFEMLMILLRSALLFQPVSFAPPSALSLNSWTLLWWLPFLPERSCHDLCNVWIVPLFVPLWYNGFHGAPKKVQNLIDLFCKLLSS